MLDNVIQHKPTTDVAPSTSPMKSLAKACKLRDSLFDKTRRDTVLDLSDLVQDRIDPVEFFRENYVTEGMRILLTEAFRRLEGKTTQGVFKLTQEMGGGKTHMLNALGLLAKHPDHRRTVMGDFYTPRDMAQYARRLLWSRERHPARNLGRDCHPTRQKSAVQRLLLPTLGTGPDRLGEPSPGRAAHHHARRVTAILCSSQV